MNLKSVIGTVFDFPKPGIAFRDINPLLANPTAFEQVVNAIAVEWAGKVQAIAALDARGFLFGAPVAQKLGIPFVPVRKKGKLPGATASIKYSLEYGEAEVEIPDNGVLEGKKVLVIDDLLATGGTAQAACKLVEQVGGIVAGCAFVIEIMELGGREKLNGYSIQSLVVYDENE